MCSALWAICLWSPIHDESRLEGHSYRYHQSLIFSSNVSQRSPTTQLSLRYVHLGFLSDNAIGKPLLPSSIS